MKLHPLVQRLVEMPGGIVIDPASLDDWLARPGEHLLFFAGDPVRFAEVLDVAVVLPELRAACAGRFDIGVVPREHEDALARRFGVQRWPSLVLLRSSGYLGTLSGMRDWGEFVAALAALLDAGVTRAPGIGIPVIAGGAPACH